MHTYSRYALAAVAVGLTVTGVRAQTATYSASHTLSTTNWVDTLFFPLFDPSLGNLTSIDFYLSGTLLGNIRFESMDAAPATVTTTLNGQILLTLPDTTLLTSVAPTLGSTDNVARFDGFIDFGGTSGVAHLGLTTTANNSFTYTNPINLAPFIGVGNIGLGVRATGNSRATGAGNIVTFNQTQAAAQVTVVYNYTGPRLGVPEPGEWAAMGVLGAGLAGLLVRARRRA